MVTLRSPKAARSFSPKIVPEIEKKKTCNAGLTDEKFLRNVEEREERERRELYKWALEKGKRKEREREPALGLRGGGLSLFPSF